jgi:hypothetical protein
MPSSAINLRMHRLMKKPLYLMIADRMTSTGSERRHQAFVETEAVVERAARGRKQRLRWIGDRGSMKDGGMTARDTCCHVIGSVRSVK